MDELVKAMTNEELVTLKEKHPDNEAIIRLVDGILETRKHEEEQEKNKKAFEEKVAKLAKLPEPPEGIYNIFMRYATVEVPDGEPEVIEVNGQPETRQPTREEKQWVVEVNKAFKVQSGTGNNQTTGTSKRAITVNRRNGNQLELVGHFASASKACEFLNIPTGGDSATRVLTREGYILDPYEGTDYTSK